MEIDDFIRKNIPWIKIPLNIKQSIGNSQEYDKKILEYSIRNQLRYRGNLVKTVKKSEKLYYDELLKYSKDHYMLFPYHLSDFIVTGMRITPFQYYNGMIQELLEREKNYDTLPNFTAADCLRLLKIGRNQYIDIMNQCRSAKKFLGMIRKPIKDLLPNKPMRDIPIDPWWRVCPGYITEDDVKLMVNPSEKEIIDRIVSTDSTTAPPLEAGDVNEKDIRSLYCKGLIYLEVPIKDDDLIVVPPLEGFVMNRVTGDYFENILYTVFVSIDENTPVAELANVLQKDLSLVKNAISMYCRLGFAYKKGNDTNTNLYHPSWSVKRAGSLSVHSNDSKENISQFVNSLNDENDTGVVIEPNDPSSAAGDDTQPKSPLPNPNVISGSNFSKRIALLYDSTLAAFLMMGNLSSGLKNHAVTMFEVGKLPDESIDSLLLELSKISDMNMDDDGEAERYFLHAIILYRTIQFLRHNPQLTGSLIDDPSEQNKGLSLDLIRCESLLNLDADTCQRLLHKNYKLIISVAPLSNETRMISSQTLPHLGASPLVNSAWFKLFIYSATGFGPPSLLLPKGVRLNTLPEIFEEYDTLMITPWGRDSGLIPVSSALIAINDAATFSPILIQAYPENNGNSNDDLIYIPLPLLDSDAVKERTPLNPFENHPAVKSLASQFDLHIMCGFITLINLETKFELPNAGDKFGGDIPNNENMKDMNDMNEWTLFDCHFGIPLFDRALNKNVTTRILSNKLCDLERLETLVRVNQKLCHDIELFISNQQLQLKHPFNDSESEHFYSFPALSKFENVVPFPSRCIMFADGDLFEWKC